VRRYQRRGKEGDEEMLFPLMTTIVSPPSVPSLQLADLKPNGKMRNPGKLLAAAAGIIELRI